MGLAAATGTAAFDITGALGAGYSPQEITDYLTANPEQAGSFRVADALKAGYSPAEIVDHLNPNAARSSAQGTPILGPIQRGIAHASAEAANLAEDLGFPATAADIRSRIPQGDLVAPQATADLSAQIKAGHYGSALADVPSAALEQFLPVTAGVAGGLVTGGAGPAAAVAGRLGAGAAVGAATQGDSIARARAANNGEAAPSASDLAVGLLGGAATGAAGSIGLGRAGSGVGGALSATLRHAGADAVQPELASLAGSVGTGAGVQNASPADMAASALTGLGVRGAMGAPAIVDGVRRVATPAGRGDAAMDQFSAMSPEQRQRATDLAGMAGDVMDAQAGAVGQSAVTPQQIAKAVAARYAAQVSDLTAVLDKAGVLPEDGVSTIRTATKAALDPNGVLTTDHLSDIGQLGLDPQTTGLIGTALQRINTLSSPDFATSSPGPAQAFMQGPGGTVLGGALGASAGLHGAALGALAGHAIRPAVSVATGRVGAMVDRMLGTASPSLLAQGQRAAAMLDAAGVTVPDTAAGLQAAMSASTDAIMAQARLMRLDPARALSAGIDAALGDKIALDRQDAVKMMNQDFVQRGGAQAQETALGRSQVLQDMQDAPAVQAQQTAPSRSEVIQDLRDATAINSAHGRGINLNEVMGNTAARLEYQKLLQETGEGGDGPISPEKIATSRAVVANPEGPLAAQVALAGLSAPITGILGLRHQPHAQDERLPVWQYRMGTDVMKALHLRGMPRNLAPAQVSEAAVRSLQQQGTFSPEFGATLMGHQGPIVRGLYNLIRNEALMAHGVDMRTLAAQRATAGPADMAAE